MGWINQSNQIPSELSLVVENKYTLLYVGDLYLICRACESVGKKRASYFTTSAQQFVYKVRKIPDLRCNQLCYRLILHEIASSAASTNGE